MNHKRYDSVRKNKLQVHQSQPLQLQYASQPKQQQNFVVALVGKEIPISILTTFIEMLNQETDIYYLWDSFHSILNSLKQAEEEAKKGDKLNKQNTLDWWKITASSQSWTGVRNMQPLTESHLKQSSRFTINTRGSVIVDNLKRQIGELTDQQKFKQNSRTIGNVAIRLFEEQELQLELIKQGRIMLTIYQIQNKYHKCHMGFCLMTQLEGEVTITKLYIAKWHRKNGNFTALVTEFIKYIVHTQNSTKIKIKINSTQGSLIRHLQSLGFKLASTLPLINQIKVFTLILLSQELKC